MKDLPVTNKERFFDNDDIIVSKTDLKGRIIYANQTSLAIADYKQKEVLGQPHSLIRHPDMPRSVFKLLWDTLQNGQEIFAYVKNRAKNGDHYWVIAHVTPSKNAQGKVIGYHSNRRVPDRAVLDETIIPLYQELLAKRASLSSVLAAALAEPQQKGAVFANQTEQVWLERIQRSEETLAYLVKHSEQNQQQNIAEYQQRLTRLNGVLTWQLKQQYPQRAWQHKQQLAELEHSLTALKARQNKVAHLSNKALAGQSNEFLLQLMKRQRQEDEKINQLKQKINQLKINVSEVIRAKVSHYINEQRALLAQHLLTTRRAMANVLEQMSSNDKRIERQLNLDSPQVKEQTL